jgi:CDP-diglyceride synthetase
MSDPKMMPKRNPRTAAILGMALDLIVYIPLIWMFWKFGKWQLNDTDWLLWLGLYWSMAAWLLGQLLWSPLKKAGPLWAAVVLLWIAAIAVTTPAELLWQDSEESREIGGLLIVVFVVVFNHFLPPQTISSIRRNLLQSPDS